MANQIEDNDPLAWLDSLYQQVDSNLSSKDQTSRLVELVTQSLLDPAPPPSLQSLEGLDELCKAINERDPQAALRVEGLVDDLAACIQDKDGAGVALGIRMGDIQEALELLGLPESTGGFQRVWRAILEAPSPQIFQKLGAQILNIDPDKLAVVVNTARVPLSTFIDLMGPDEAQELLSKMAPHLSYADFRGLDDDLQKDLLELCDPAKLHHLFISSSQVEELPAGMESLIGLNCSKCTGLKSLPTDMKVLQILDCSECSELKHLPEKMKLLQDLVCTFCKELASLPDDMETLQSLKCSNCDELESLPANMKTLRNLDCSKCGKLDKLPVGMEVLQSLTCRGCHKLEKLPEGMEALQILLCMQCEGLVSLPDGMVALKTLECWQCDNLTSLPEDVAALEYLDCSQCSRLESVPDSLASLTCLCCEECDSLTSIPVEMASIQSLDCCSCPRLLSLPVFLPECIYLDFRDSQLLENMPTPEVPANAEVYRSGGEQGSWQVPYEEIPAFPKAFLCELGINWLLDGRPFPSVAYQEKDGQPFEGIDVGGVRRDLVSRILTHLFRENLEDGKAFLERTRDQQPVWKSEDEDQQTAYSTLARLMALSYRHVCNLTTGPLFSERVYQALLTEPESFERAAALMGLEADLVQLAIGKKLSDEALHPEIKGKIYFYLDRDEDKFDNVDDALAHLKDNPDALMKGILAEMNDEGGPWLSTNKAIEVMRQEFQKAFGMDAWEKIQQKGADRLQKEIEGELSADALLAHLDWVNELSLDAEVQQTKAYFEDWLKRASEKDLQTFVQAVTANRSLTPARITIKLYRRGDENIPTAHSCFSSLELSSQLRDQETFDLMMGKFLEYALAGSGFQFG